MQVGHQGRGLEAVAYTVLCVLFVFAVFVCTKILQQRVFRCCDGALELTGQLVWKAA